MLSARTSKLCFCSLRKFIHTLTLKQQWLPVITASQSSSYIGGFNVERRSQHMKVNDDVVMAKSTSGSSQVRRNIIADAQNLAIGMTTEDVKVKSRLDEQIERTPSHEQLFLLISDFELNARHAVSALKKLRELSDLHLDHETCIQEIVSDPMFDKICKTLHRNVLRLEPNVLIVCLDILLCMTSQDLFIIESLNKQVAWLFNKLPIGQVVNIFLLYHKHQETDERKQLYVNSLSIIERRWVEITNPKDIISLMYVAESKNDKLFTKLEDRALDLAETMSSKDLYRILYFLAKLKRRNTPLLRAIMYHMNKSEIMLSDMQLKNLLYSCSVMNLYNSALMEKISSHLHSRIPCIENTSLLAAFLTSFGHLRWRDVELLDYIQDDVLDNYIDMRPLDLAQVLISVATLNCANSKFRSQIHRFDNRLLPLAQKEPVLWLDAMWSLAVLGKLRAEQAASVLDPTFFIKLPSKDAFKLLTCHVKLLNIQAEALLCIPEYNGPTVPEESCSHSLQTLSKAEHTLTDSVIGALTNLAPANSYSKLDVTTQYGYLLDAELFVNKNGQPQPYAESMSNIDQDQQLYRIGLKVLNFADMTLHSAVPIGLHSMASRHLQLMGYTIVEVPYMEFDPKATVVKKVQYLETKIMDAITGTDSTPQTEDATIVEQEHSVQS